ncbi:DUF58 domain-containing protein [Paenibacillus turpanensis]|uniref:DUF58 domain-containing protein n=1 Tax=Paenibacillus turpanensis TaxID=2689078 RepID=UPI00140944B2|nr:DUF58 domain-containing protein [Paenibacillus turpanensis]
MKLHWFIANIALLFWLLIWLYSRYALKHIGYSRHFSEKAVFEGESVEMVERISNRKLLPLPWLRLESRVSTGLVFGSQGDMDIRGGEQFQHHLSLFSLRPYRQIVRKHQVVCARRGIYKLNSAAMTSGDPLGIKVRTEQVPLSLELVVYPKPAPLGELPLPSHSWLGELAVRRWIVEDPFLTSGSREYQPGDPLNAVNWKATARTGELQVHKKDFTADHRLMICLNFEVTESMWSTVTDPERVERAIRYAAAVADYALARGIDTGLLCNGWTEREPKEAVHIEPGGGMPQLTQLLETMAALQLDSCAAMDALIKQMAEKADASTDYLLISCHEGERLRGAAEELARRGNGIEWLLVADQGVGLP